MSHLRMFQNEGPTIPLGIDNVGRKLKGFQALSWDMHHTWYQDVSTPRPAYQGSASVFRYGRHIAKIANVCVLLILKPVATVASRMRHRTKREQRVFENRNQRTRDKNDVLGASIQYVMNNMYMKWWKDMKCTALATVWKQSRLVRHVFHDSMLYSHKLTMIMSMQFFHRMSSIQSRIQLMLQHLPTTFKMPMHNCPWLAQSFRQHGDP